MPFAAINGFTIPLMECSQEYVEIGSRDRSASGSILIDRQATKRKWICRTRPLKEIEAMQLINLVQGEGHFWNFDDDSDVANHTQLFCSKGLGPVTSPDSYYTEIDKVAADGDAVAIWNGTSAIDTTEFNSAVSFDNTTVNLFAEAIRKASDHTAFTALNGATLTTDTSNYWEGASCVKCVTDVVGGDSEGLYASINPGAGSDTKTYYASAYVKGAVGGEVINFKLYDATNIQVGASQQITLVADTWIRCVCSLTITGGDCADLRLQIFEYSADSGITFYVDGFQIEKGSVSTLTSATAWYDGTRSNNNGWWINYSGTPFYAGWGDMTFNFWFQTIHSGMTGASRYLFQMRDSAGDNRIGCYISSSGGHEYVYLRTKYVGAFGTLVGGYGTPEYTDGAWHMITCVIRRFPETGEYSTSLYIDGSLVGTPVTETIQYFHTMNILCVGNYGTASALAANATIDNFMIVPFAATSGLIAKWYEFRHASWNTATPSLPIFYFNGDIMPETAPSASPTKQYRAAMCMGRITGIEYVTGNISGTFYKNLRRISFEAEET